MKNSLPGPFGNYVIKIPFETGPRTEILSRMKSDKQKLAIMLGMILVGVVVACVVIFVVVSRYYSGPSITFR